MRHIVLINIVRCSCLSLLLSFLFLFCPNHSFATTPNGAWDAELETPGGSLRFRLELIEATDGWRATLVNGPEKIEVPKASVENGMVVVDLAHFDAKIEAQYDASNDIMTGTYRKRRGIDKVAQIPFRAARPSGKPGERPSADAFVGRWKVQFSSSDEPAVGIFQRDQEGRLWGTFLTTVGDYRYLAGRIVGGQFELSCFDGGHAFLMRAKPQQDGSLSGDFWSGNWWHETWTAERDEDFELPNAFELSRWNEHIALASLEFPDLDGHVRKVITPELIGKPLILEVFGSWCPNCHDAGAYLSEVAKKYEQDGLRVVGLAFELTGDLKRDADQVRKYMDRHRLEFPVYICGLSDKKEASAQFPALDRIRAYPTLIFVDSQHQVRSVYTGFSGPATGERHERLKEQFGTIIEGMLRDMEQ